MIDAHIHAVAALLPGSLATEGLWPEGPEASARRLREVMAAAGVTHALAMGRWETTETDPLGVEATLALAESVPGLAAIGAINPLRAGPQHLERVEAALQDRRIRALKCYLGYSWFGPEDPVYAPYYRLAARNGLPVVFHTGDTYSRTAKVKYAHPLRVDEVAVDHPDVRFVLAHFGNPWLLDAAEVIYKNDNVWADLSAIVVGDTGWFANAERSGLLERTAARVREAFDFSEKPERFLFGTDWPLSPVEEYAAFVRQVVPPSYHTAIFEANARSLFRL
jgi:hypothetical protein